MNPATRTRLHGLRNANDDHAALLAALRPRFGRMAHRHENGTAPRAVSAFQLFQTPPELAHRLVGLLGAAARGRVLEPSAGLGRLLEKIAPLSPTETVAIEIAPACAGELFRQNRAGVRILQRDFLTCMPAELGLFDAVAMNPPFHLRADIRHILHARTFLRPGGILVALCLDTPHRHAALRPLARTWEPVPAGVFAKEGTTVQTVLLTMVAPP